MQHSILQENYLKTFTTNEIRKLLRNCCLSLYERLPEKDQKHYGDSLKHKTWLGIMKDQDKIYALESFVNLAKDRISVDLELIKKMEELS